MIDEKLIDISTIQKKFSHKNFRRFHLTNEPMDLFKKWLEQAFKMKFWNATIMNLGTVDNQGKPYQRLVLLKKFSKYNIIFFTNLNSRKANHLKNNPFVSLHFSWTFMKRQVLILGKAQKLSTYESSEYFYSRPKNNQISALISNQSHYVSSRNTLERKFFMLKEKLKNKKVPYPNYWGGYKITINEIEFWQDGNYRLHDRFLYKKQKDGTWKINRLFP